MPKQDSPSPGFIRSWIRPFSHTLDSSDGSIVIIPNESGHATIAFYVSPPTGATVVFEEKTGGGPWIPFTVRSKDQEPDTYGQSSASSPGNFIGSIANTTVIRFRVTGTGSSDGLVGGVTTENVAILEGIEFGWPPHQRGVLLDSKFISLDAPATNQVLWPVPSGKRLIVLGLHGSLTGSSNEMVARSGTTGRHVLAIETAQGQPSAQPIHHAAVHPPGGDGEDLLVSMSSSGSLRLVALGYLI